jgi:DNA replication and repair protein RecF
MRPLAIESLSVRAFRNLARVDLALGPGFNVISGDNGQGKTNLLEAIYALATSRSFRTSKFAELVGGTEKTASVRASLREDGQHREHTLGIGPHLRAVRIDGKRPPTLAAYAIRTPIVVFHSGVMALAAGSGIERRRLLDRLALYLQPASLADSAGYAKAARARQHVLEGRGELAPDLDGWEELMVRHGNALTQARETAASRLAAAAAATFAGIGAPGAAFGMHYERSAPSDAEAFRKMLVTTRSRDRARGWAGIGPHRDDLVLELGGRPVRGIASQGQHRAVVLALELAEMDVIGDACGARPILLLDDVSSELDRVRTSALFETLIMRGGQVVVTTTRPELLGAPATSPLENRVDFTVVRGCVETLSVPGAAS